MTVERDPARRTIGIQDCVAAFAGPEVRPTDDIARDHRSHPDAGAAEQYDRQRMVTVLQVGPHCERIGIVFYDNAKSVVDSSPDLVLKRPLQRHVPPRVRFVRQVRRETDLSQTTGRDHTRDADADAEDLPPVGRVVKAIDYLYGHPDDGGSFPVVQRSSDK